MMVADRIKEIPGFPAKTAAELKHCILAHHGELEYGSPKKPALLAGAGIEFRGQYRCEDGDDAGSLKERRGESGWLGYNRFLETNVRKNDATE